VVQASNVKGHPDVYYDAARRVHTSGLNDFGTASCVSLYDGLGRLTETRQHRRRLHRGEAQYDGLGRVSR
jgi:YD repeat-containing protein